VIDKWKTLLAPGLLVAVAAAQLFHVWRSDLTPWKGGGFGMFATGDSLAGRYIRVYLEDTKSGEPRQTAVDMPRIDGRPLQGMYDRAVASPSQERLAELGATISSLKWAYYATGGDDDDERRVGQSQDSDDLQWSAPAGADGDDAKAPQRDASSTRAYASDDRRVRSVPPTTPVTYNAVRVELWRFMLQRGGSTVSAGPVAVARIPRGAQQSQNFRRF
jgi:hypothetical protein